VNAPLVFALEMTLHWSPAGEVARSTSTGCGPAPDQSIETEDPVCTIFVIRIDVMAIVGMSKRLFGLRFGCRRGN